MKRELVGVLECKLALLSVLYVICTQDLKITTIMTDLAFAESISYMD
jgi:hypothetical protein